MSKDHTEQTVINVEYPAVWEPADVKEAVMLKLQYGEEAAFIAGGTLLRTQWEGGIVSSPAHLIRLDTIQGMRGITEHEHEIVVGALTSLKECGTHPLIRTYAGVLYSACKHIAAPSIRNLATIGGNIASTVGDSIPALLVHQARLLWADPEHASVQYEQYISDWLEEVREGQHKPSAVLLGIAFSKPAALYTIQTNDSAAWICNSDEWIVGIEQKHSHESMFIHEQSIYPASLSWREIGFFRKLGRREAFTASVVTVAFQALISNEGHFIHVKIAAGGGSKIAMRLSNCEKYIEGKMYHSSLVSQLAERAAAEFISYSDTFATEEYRKKAAGNLLAAGLWETWCTEQDKEGI